MKCWKQILGTMWRGEQRLVSVFLDAYVGTLGQVIAPQIAQRKCEEHFQNCQWSPVRYHFGYWCQGRFLVRNMPGNYKGACENVTDLCRVCALLCSLMRRRLHSCCAPPSLLACFGYFWFSLVSDKKSQLPGQCFQNVTESVEQSMTFLCDVITKGQFQQWQ